MDLRTAHALVRFGLGRRGTEPPPADPAGWLRDQIRAPAPPPEAPVPTLAEALDALRYDGAKNPPPAERHSPRLYVRDAGAAVAAALNARTPFRERLVWFWSNHFTVSGRGLNSALMGPFVAEAIRPHVTGRFGDMLLAVVRHPAMLMYLDNQRSIGPDSVAGRRTGRGLNENLGRECLELHTVSPASGYTQQDVISFARILTGWSVELRQDPLGFKFRPNWHEPGPKTLMGQVFPAGEEGGIAALGFLARHPATHRHLAIKLARHFVADDPPPDTVRGIEGALRDTGGDLAAAAAAVVETGAAWKPGTKLRTPMDYVVATLRTLDLAVPPPQTLRALRLLGQPLWTAPQPNGWPDRAADWAASEAMMRRADVAYLAAGIAGPRDAAELGDAALGPLLRPATMQAINRAGSRREALALLFSAPEFQRR